MPDIPKYRTSAFNPAGNSFQTQLVRGLAASGLDLQVFSARPIASYPKTARLLYWRDRETIDGLIDVHLLGFVNLTPVKQIAMGLGVLLGILAWGWRKRKRRRIVLTYNLTAPPGIFTLLAARLVGAKAVVSVNDINVPGETVPDSPLFRLDFELQRWLLPRYDGYLVVADEIARDFFPGRPYLRIEGGVDSAFLARTSRRADTREQGSPVIIVFAGWLNEANGIPLVLGALELLRGLNIGLKVAGAGPLQSMVERAVAKDPRIEYVGMLDSVDVAELYAGADVLLNVRLTKEVNTRYFFPSKLIECLGSGVPTITTKVAHVETEFEGLAFFLEDESPQGLAELIARVCAQDADRRWLMGSRARACVAKSMTWEVQAAKLEQYLNALLQRSDQTVGNSK